MKAKSDRPRKARAATTTMPRDERRSPAWRWERALAIVEQSARRDRRKDDAWVGRAVTFLKALARAAARPDARRPVALDPPMLGAWRLRRGEPRRRWEVEARLLAGQDDREIAAKVGVDAGAIEAYEALHYSVRDHLAATDWVAFVAIGPRLYLGLDPEDTEIVWKLFAYNGGPHVLDALIASPPGGSGGTAADPGLAGQFRMLLAALTLEVTPENALAVIGLHQESCRLEREAAAAGVAAVAGPVNVPGEVLIGPESAPGVRAGCAPGGEDRAVPAPDDAMSAHPGEAEGDLRAIA